MDGFALVVRLLVDREAAELALGARALSQPPLDPALAVSTVRAGLGLIQSGMISFVYANPDECVALLRRDVIAEVGQSLTVHDHLVSEFAGRLALLAGRPLPVAGQIYEFPDIGVVRKALRTCVEEFEQSTPLRSATRLGAQLRGRGQPFHASMIETLEEQTHLLQQAGIDMDTLPSWWWRGVAARMPTVGTGIELWSELPATEALLGLIA
ncbi:hypothetical protein ACNOYE_24375 [Nannocystaceae bacterium ST9]